VKKCDAIMGGAEHIQSDPTVQRMGGSAMASMCLIMCTKLW